MKKLLAVLLLSSAPTMAVALESAERTSDTFDRNQAARVFVECVSNSLETQSYQNVVDGRNQLVARVFETCKKAHGDMIALTEGMTTDEAGRYLAAATGRAFDAIDNWRQKRGML